MNIRVSALALVAALALACGSQESQQAAAPASPPAAEPAQPAAEPAEPAPAAPQPADSASAEVPAPSGEPSASRGESLYATNCSSCHGLKGAGDGPAAAALQPQPAKHSNGEYMNSLSNEHLFKVTKFGGPAVGKSPLMAPWGGVLNDDQIWDVIAFVRSLANPPYPGSVP